MSVAAVTVRLKWLFHRGRLPAPIGRPVHRGQQPARSGARRGGFMIEGILIAESLRVGTTLASLNLTVRTISRFRAQGTTQDQPDVWTTLDFEADEAGATNLAEAFSDVLDRPGWYVNFESPTDAFVVFPGRIFHYPRGDETGRAEAQAYGRQLAIPEPQLDWTV